MPDCDLIRMLEILWTETNLSERAMLRKEVSEFEESFSGHRELTLTVVYANQSMIAAMKGRDLEKAVAYFKRSCDWFNQMPPEIPGDTREFIKKRLYEITNMLDVDRIKIIQEQSFFNPDKYLN